MAERIEPCGLQSDRRGIVAGYWIQDSIGFGSDAAGFERVDAASRPLGRLFSCAADVARRRPVDGRLKTGVFRNAPSYRNATSGDVVALRGYCVIGQGIQGLQARNGRQNYYFSGFTYYRFM